MDGKVTTMFMKYSAFKSIRLRFTRKYGNNNFSQKKVPKIIRTEYYNYE